MIENYYFDLEYLNFLAVGFFLILGHNFYSQIQILNDINAFGLIIYDFKHIWILITSLQFTNQCKYFLIRPEDCFIYIQSF